MRTGGAIQVAAHDPYVIRDGKLITGQNQQPASEYALLVLHTLTGRRGLGRTPWCFSRHLTAINDATGERRYKQSRLSFLERATIAQLPVFPRFGAGAVTEMRVTDLAVGLAAFTLLSSVALPQGGPGSPSPEIHVPNHPDKPLFAGEQGRQRTEIHYDPKTGLVRLSLVVQDSNGYFIPDIRRENVAVYENGVRQRDATVEIEHAAVCVGVLVEYGGRYHALNEALATTMSMAVGQFADEIGAEDEVAIWKYGDRIEEIAGFSRGKESLQQAATSLQSAPPFSELNFYDALIAALPRLQDQRGRRALLIFSSGIDTFSKASYADALAAAGRSDVPIYALNVGPVIRSDASLYGQNGPYTRLDWKGAEQKLGHIARASGGRMYSPDSSLDLAAIYDDLMENLRVRYVIIYKSAARPEEHGPRTVRVKLVDSRTGGSLRIVDADARPVHPRALVETRYDPAAPDSRTNPDR